jgi:hypothetical protein
VTSLLIGIYGVYLIAVGVKGNTSTLVADLESDFPGFVPWLIVVIVLVSLYDVPELKGPVEAFAVLAALTLLVSQKSKIIPQFEAFYQAISTTSATSN